jgi:hypothetical protein
MQNTLHLRLAIVLLDRNHAVKGVALSEGQPRYAVRKALEDALRLCAATPVEGTPRLVILPAGSGVMPIVLGRAIAMSKVGQYLPGLERDDVLAQGRRQAVLNWAGVLGDLVRSEKARPVMATRVA